MVRRATKRTTKRPAAKSSAVSNFKYHKRSKESVKQRAVQTSNNFASMFKKNIPVFFPKENHYVVRILPPTWDDSDHFGLDVYVHYGVGGDRESYLCLEKMLNKPCPICEERKNKNTSSEETKELTPKRRVLVYVIDRDNEKEGPQLWSMPWTVDRDLGQLSIDARTQDVIYIEDPDDGFDIEFTKKGAQLLTKYIGLKISRYESTITDDDDMLEKWLQFIVDNPIPECLNYYDYDHIEQVFNGANTDDDVEDDEGEDVDSIEEEEEEDSEEEIEEEPDLPWGDEEDGEEEEEEEEDMDTIKKKLRNLNRRGR